MKILLLTLTLLLAGCGSDFSTITAEVVIVGSLPSATPGEKTNAVLYRVAEPGNLSGKYGVDFTTLSPPDVEKKIGTTFTIQRTGKWRHLLFETPPTAASVSKGEDFFSNARPK